MRRGHAVDQIQHRNPLVGGFLNKVVEAVQRDGTDDQAVRFIFEGFLDLTALKLELVVTAGLVD